MAAWMPADTTVSEGAGHLGFDFLHAKIFHLSTVATAVPHLSVPDNSLLANNVIPLDKACDENLIYCFRSRCKNLAGRVVEVHMVLPHSLVSPIITAVSRRVVRKHN